MTTRAIATPDGVAWRLSGAAVPSICVIAALSVAASAILLVDYSAISARMAQQGQMIGIGVGGMVLLGQPAIVLAYAAIALLLREAVLVLAGHSDGPSRAVRVASRYIAYVLFAFGVFVACYAAYFHLAYDKGTLIQFLRDGLRSALEFWFYGAVLLVLARFSGNWRAEARPTAMIEAEA